MATELEFVTYKDFVKDLDDSSDTPSANAKAVVCDGENDPVAVPANANALENSATESDMTEGNVVEVWTPSGKKKLDLSNVGKKGDITSLNTKTTNISASVAPAFDPTRDSEHAYPAGYSVTYTDGKVYTFTAPHYGSWTGTDVEEAPAATSKLDYFVVTDNPEYMAAVTDKDGVFLFGVRKDGSVDFPKGVPSPIRKEIDAILERISFFNFISSPEWAFAIVDSDNKFLFGINRTDGTVHLVKGVPEIVKTYVDTLVGALENGKVDKVSGKELIDSGYAGAQGSATNPEFLKMLTDISYKLLEAVDNNGRRIFFTRPVFRQGFDMTQEGYDTLGKALKAAGFSGGQGDWSDADSLQIQKPKLAIIDFSNIDAMPTSKTQDLNGIMRFWDNEGNYFKKKVIMNAQGNSSLRFVKKNISIDICNDDWVGDDTFSVKFGKWVAQDSFHIKAYYTDFFRGIAVVGYDIYNDIVTSRGPSNDRTWKMADVDMTAQSSCEALGVGQSKEITHRIDDGARCFPDGFPVLVYLNGEFYGIFEFQLKKHRDNYMMDKAVAEHVHLDGALSEATLFGGTVDWTAFEIRNPKNLWTIEGTKYDGDNPSEIVDAATAEQWISAGVMPSGTSVSSKIAGQLRTTGKVRQYVETFAAVQPSITAAATDAEKKEIFESVYNLDNLIDYQIFSDVIHNLDGFSKNWQWTTWDGVHWYVNAYDLDMTFGSDFLGRFIYKPRTSRLKMVEYNPCYYAVQLYPSEVDTRYAELREKKIVDAAVFADKVANLTKLIGDNNYQLEYEKWPESPCNNNMTVNSNWELVVDGNGKPVISNSNEGFYSATTTYAVGDTCVFNGEKTARWFYTFRATASTTGQEPAVLAFVDSLWRVAKWCEETIGNMDVVYNYTNNQ